MTCHRSAPHFTRLTRSFVHCRDSQMWYTAQQRLLFAAVGTVAGAAAVLDTRHFVLHQTDSTADRWVSPPPPGQPLPVGATCCAPRALPCVRVGGTTELLTPSALCTHTVAAPLPVAQPPGAAGEVLERRCVCCGLLFGSNSSARTHSLPALAPSGVDAAFSSLIWECSKRGW